MEGGACFWTYTNYLYVVMNMIKDVEWLQKQKRLFFLIEIDFDT